MIDGITWFKQSAFLFQREHNLYIDPLGITDGAPMADAILLTHAHADWADLARRLIGQLGLDSSRNEIGRLISGLAGLGPRQYSETGRLPSGTERWRPWRADASSAARRWSPRIP